MFKKIALSAFASLSLLNAAGYKVPEQSSDSLSLAASNIAFSFGPDAAYYNPANMVFLPDSRHYFENTLAWFHIDPLDFKNKNGKDKFTSNKFDSMASTFHFVSPEYYENWRFGLSLAVPAGLGIGWNDPHPSFTGKRFKLKSVELNPSIAYRISDSFAIGGGLRAVYTKGRVATDLYGLGQRELKGDSIDYGYNLAITYKPTSDLSFAATYRSQVDLSIKGKADISSSLRALGYNGGVSVEIPLPATLALATSYKINNTTLLFAYERTFWSKFKGYDFEYNNPPNNGMFKALFDDKVNRNYQDSNAFRFGIAYDVNENLRVMGGFAYDQNGANDPKSVSFDLPDTKAYVYSAGLTYKATENLEFGLGGLYQDRKSVSSEVKIATPNPQRLFIAGAMNGDFSDAKIWIIGTSIKYKF